MPERRVGAIRRPVHQNGRHPHLAPYGQKSTLSCFRTPPHEYSKYKVLKIRHWNNGKSQKIFCLSNKLYFFTSQSKIPNAYIFSGEIAT